MRVLLWVLVGTVLLLAGVMLEGWRQSRRLRAEGSAGGTRPSLLGVGGLELQRMLQPDRRVEIVLEEQKDADRVRPEHRPGAADDEGPR